MNDSGHVFIQHRWGNAIHIIREQSLSGVYFTQCGREYQPAQAFTPDLRGEREEDVVCSDCRHRAAAQAGKKVYRQPILRRSVSEAKRYMLKNALREYQDRQKLAAWKRATEVQP